MAEKPKDHNLETRTQKTAIENKVPKAATERAFASAPGENAMSPEKPETAQGVTPEERWNMIAEAAYYLAEKRAFAGGHPADDWAAAEAQIDAQLAGRKF